MIKSIRQRLLLTLLSFITLVSGITIVLGFRSAQHEVEELFDAQLAQSARVLQTIVLPDLTNNDSSNHKRIQPMQSSQSPYIFSEDTEHSGYGHEYERKIAFQVWDKRKNLILRSASAPQHPLSLVGLNPNNRGFISELVEQDQWRVFNLWNDNDTILIQIGERYDVRGELTDKISGQLLMPIFFSLPLLGLLIWIGIGRGLAPVKHVAQEVTRREPHYLAPMDIGPVPSEIRPLVDELNTLFEQLRDAFDKERRFTDDAAHELRTPLAALKTQAQVAIRAKNDEERNQALNQVVKSVDRATHLVEQMLTLARINPQEYHLDLQTVCLHDLAAELIAEIVPKAIKKNIVLSLTGDEKITTKVEPVSISILLRNLIDNAVNYSKPSSSVVVDIAKMGERLVLSIDDCGPGIENKYKERVFDRFYRALGSNAQGCGLGLAIVKQIADYHHLEIQMENKVNGSGLIVRVYFTL